MNKQTLFLYPLDNPLTIVILRLTFAIIAGVLHHYFFLPLRPQHGLQSCQPTSLSAISTQALASYTSSHSAGYRWASQPTVSQSCSFNIPSSIKPDNISLLGLYARSRFICRVALWRHYLIFPMPATIRQYQKYRQHDKSSPTMPAELLQEWYDILLFTANAAYFNSRHGRFRFFVPRSIKS